MNRAQVMKHSRKGIYPGFETNVWKVEQLQIVH